ncbi:TPA: signal peptide peptidase SppA [Candidatus Dependentiae bacterium]|nr:MAG: Signal peptide peptidase SppA, 36K type [candidate division TM6 bacterium GW2011_GWE2_31_21]KKP54106.1 MAG: Signal peptide peptidase SppA, 36K type [candidate division TM6 bacterium GW2011_GWF2_33_332]HBS48312.1 signal peptide peptidase SppA [Candidatus Dependentiae bacterium]HBZ73014.1 signal peptide peptidase SppA [Candidatus Dependentiae bacterium]
MANTNGSSRFSNFLKNFLIILIILQFVPIVYTSVKKTIKKVVSPDTEVGVIKIGTINSSEYVIKQIQKFHKNSDIKALLLQINSPGGLPGASQAIFNELKKFKKDKPVVVLVEDLAASGGYYVACCADKIIANPSSLIGSIGVVCMLPNIEKLLQRFNIKVDEVKSGKYKTILSTTRERSLEETALLQSVSDDVYKQFTSDVATNRNLHLQDEKIWADGKIFTGNQALKLKLVDELGSLSDATETIKNLLKERGVKVEGKIKYIRPKPTSTFAKLFGSSEEDQENQVALTSLAANSISQIWHKFLSNETSENSKLIS